MKLLGQPDFVSFVSFQSDSCIPTTTNGSPRPATWQGNAPGFLSHNGTIKPEQLLCSTMLWVNFPRGRFTLHLFNPAVMIVSIQYANFWCLLCTLIIWSGRSSWLFDYCNFSSEKKPMASYDKKSLSDPYFKVSFDDDVISRPVAPTDILAWS